MDNIDRAIMTALFVLVFTLSILSSVKIRKNKANFESQLSHLESRIAKQDTLLQHHLKKAEFDSTNQANQKRVK